MGDLEVKFRNLEPQQPWAMFTKGLSLAPKTS